MSTTFIVSDTHFGHAGVCRFLREDGTKLRPWEDPELMTQELISRWNALVGPQDKVYHLGDVVINRRYLAQVMPQLNGRKVLIKGNHDIFKLQDYLPWFYDIRAYHVLDRCILSHVPVHSSQLGRFKANVHGHTHDRLVGVGYVNCCVEHTDWAPQALEVVLQRVAAQPRPAVGVGLPCQ